MRRILLTAILLAAVLAPVSAHAANLVKFPLVPCGVQGSGGNSEPCTPCHLFEAADRVINLILFGITGPIAAFVVVLAGGMMLLGGASPATYSRGKSLLSNTLMGVTVILLSWVATNFLIKSIATGSDGDNWYEFTCPDFLAGIEAENIEVTPGPPAGLPLPPAPPAQAPTSDNIEVGGLKGAALYQKLATANGLPFPARSSSALTTLIDCLYQDKVIAALTFPKPANGGAVQSGNFTYDNSNMACNFTRGQPVGGGSCSHGSRSGVSCHYGGRTGKDGAEAVDFNARLTTVTVPGVLDSAGQPKKVNADERTLFCELYRVLVKEKKCAFKFLNWEGDHSHISTVACDADGPVGSRGGVSGLPPGGCPSSIVTPSTSAAPANP